MYIIEKEKRKKKKGKKKVEGGKSRVIFFVSFFLINLFIKGQKSTCVWIFFSKFFINFFPKINNYSLL